jgi:hypothetical protein
LDKLLTTEQVAVLLEKPESTVAQWRYEGLGPPYIRIHNHVRYREADLEAWVEANRVVPEQAPRP